MDQIGDIEIIRSQFADAQADVRLWLSVAKSNKERTYLRRVQEQLCNLERILDRIELRGVSAAVNQWEENVKAFLEAFRGARIARGCVVGTDLGLLADRLENRAEQTEGTRLMSMPNNPNRSVDGTRAEEEKKPLSWQEIEIAFLSDERVEIRRGSNVPTSYNYGELGFEDRRNGAPNQAWMTLRVLAEKTGEILRPVAGQPRATTQKRIEEIRRWLRNHFKIEGDPIPFNGNSYKASFKVGCRPSFHT